MRSSDYERPGVAVAGGVTVSEWSSVRSTGVASAGRVVSLGNWQDDSQSAFTWPAESASLNHSQCIILKVIMIMKETRPISTVRPATFRGEHLDVACLGQIWRNSHGNIWSLRGPHWLNGLVTEPGLTWESVNDTYRTAAQTVWLNIGYES